ncbi:hypothetical protein BLNAU_20291 [Blattamonas nauphoetae]|uniref:Tyrosine-protein phosphatase domain-containing protein n=1 Tax=Blattamonas nauphoetae TaxID=2049346 RepID=A0ABQ9WZK8_9EUKA|nr:hypothetical protein BLNAU_20291 [Blattamonas nauphoetae]
MSQRKGQPKAKATQRSGSPSPTTRPGQGAPKSQAGKRGTNTKQQDESQLLDADVLSLPPVSKFKDGMFVGTYEASMSEDFITSNKITHVINCAGSHVPNRFARIGIQYLTFYLQNDDSSIFIDNEGKGPESVYHFIEEAISLYEGVMIHSVLGKDRALLITAAFLMRKFEWDAAFAIELVSTCRHTRMRPAFERQLYDYEPMLPPVAWTPELYEEEYVIRNTYFNKRIVIPSQPPAKATRQRVQFYLLQTNLGSTLPPGRMGEVPTYSDEGEDTKPARSIYKGMSKTKVVGTTDQPPAVLLPPPELLSQCKSEAVFEWMFELCYQAGYQERVCDGNDLSKEPALREEAKERGRNQWAMVHGKGKIKKGKKAKPKKKDEKSTELEEKKLKEDEKKAKDEEDKRKQEEERKKQEEADRQKKLEDKKRAEEEEKKRQQKEEEERKKAEEKLKTEQRRKEEAEKQRKVLEEKERKRKADEERKRKEEEERIRLEEARKEEEKKRVLEEERYKLEAERERIKEEKLRIQKERERQLEEKRREEEKKRLEEERLEQEMRRQVEEERKRRNEEKRAIIARKEEEERLKQEREREESNTHLASDRSSNSTQRHQQDTQASKSLASPSQTTAKPPLSSTSQTVETLSRDSTTPAQSLSFPHNFLSPLSGSRSQTTKADTPTSSSVNSPNTSFPSMFLEEHNDKRDRDSPERRNIDEVVPSTSLSETELTQRTRDEESSDAAIVSPNTLQKRGSLVMVQRNSDLQTPSTSENQSDPPKENSTTANTPSVFQTKDRPTSHRSIRDSESEGLSRPSSAYKSSTTNQSSISVAPVTVSTSIGTRNEPSSSQSYNRPSSPSSYTSSTQSISQTPVSSNRPSAISYETSRVTSSQRSESPSSNLSTTASSLTRTDSVRSNQLNSTLPSSQSITSLRPGSSAVTSLNSASSQNPVEVPTNHQMSLSSSLKNLSIKKQKKKPLSFSILQTSTMKDRFDTNPKDHEPKEKPANRSTDYSEHHSSFESTRPNSGSSYAQSGSTHTHSSISDNHLSTLKKNQFTVPSVNATSTFMNPTISSRLKMNDRMNEPANTSSGTPLIVRTRPASPSSPTSASRHSGFSSPHTKSQSTGRKSDVVGPSTLPSSSFSSSVGGGRSQIRSFSSSTWNTRNTPPSTAANRSSQFSAPSQSAGSSGSRPASPTRSSPRHQSTPSSPSLNTSTSSLPWNKHKPRSLYAFSRRTSTPPRSSQSGFTPSSSRSKTTSGLSNGP